MQLLTENVGKQVKSVSVLIGDQKRLRAANHILIEEPIEPGSFVLVDENGRLNGTHQRPATTLFGGAGVRCGDQAIAARRMDAELVARYAGVEIMRRLIGVAQLPIAFGIDRKRALLNLSRRLVVEPGKGFA